MGRNPSLKRQSSYFQLLWTIFVKEGVDPRQATIDQVAGGIVQRFQFSEAQAMNAYSAMLLIPGFESIRFHRLLVP